MKAQTQPFIGTAAWTIPPPCRDLFPTGGSHLECYSRIFNAVEINSSFYRDHKPESYRRWSEAVPAEFRFSVKLSRFFTQEKRLTEAGDPLLKVLEGISHLGQKWGVLLVQLPPSLRFEEATVSRFLKALRRFHSGLIAWEPRHPSWSTQLAVQLLADYQINKVRADPEPCPLGAPMRAPLEKALYYRLHGTPEIYKSPYTPDQISRLSLRLEKACQQGKTTWCIFDNTVLGHATRNALELQAQCNRFSSKTSS